MDRIDPAAGAQRSPARPGPSAAAVRSTLFVSGVALGIAALVHFVRYLLLIINRSTLLNPVVAAAAVWLGVLAGLAAMVAMIVNAVLLTRWLIARRAAAFNHRRLPEPRRSWALWAGCLVPPSVALALAMTFEILLAKLDHRPSWALIFICLVMCFLPLVALVWALVFVIELAKTEGHYDRLRKPIWVWWLLWLFSGVASVFATTTGGAQDAQGIANATVAMTVAYLLALAAVVATGRVFEGFVRKPVERPAHRWIVLPDDHQTAPKSGAAVEFEGQEPAA